MTEKLYYQDPYQFEFQARVLSARDENGRLGVILDRTCFYPEGGGQPADLGFLNDCPVRDVQQVGNDVVHFVEKSFTGLEVHGSVDPDRRRDYMQQHTGQHILSQSLLRVSRINTVSVHFGEEYTAIETDVPQISPQNVDEVERLANRIVCENLPVTIQWVDPGELENYNIRRPPPEVESVRVIQVGDFDASACGGLHVLSTGQVGLIKIIGQEKIRGRIRIQVKIGERAYQDYQRKTLWFQQLTQTLTCGEDDVLKRVADLSDQLRDARRDLLKFQSDSARNSALGAIKQGMKFKNGTYAYQVFENVESKVLKVFIDEVIKEPGNLALAISRDDRKLLWMIGHSIPGKFDISQFVKPLLPLIDARGGGSSTFMQGGGRNCGGIDEFVKQFNLKLAREINKDE